MSSQQAVADSGFLPGFLRVLPLIQWILMICIAVGMYFLSTRDSQTVQAQQLGEVRNEQRAIRDTVDKNKAEREKQLDDLKRQMLTKEVFEAYHQNDSERFGRMEKLLEQLLSNQTR